MTIGEFMNKEQFKLELKQHIKEAKLKLKDFDRKHPNVHTYDKLVTKKHYANLAGLQEFIKLHTELSDEDIVKLINENAKIFKFLDFYIEVLPDGIELLRDRGYALSTMIFEANVAQQLKNAD